MEPQGTQDHGRGHSFWQETRPVKNWVAGLIILLLFFGVAAALLIVPGQMHYLAGPHTYVLQERASLLDAGPNLMRSFTGTANGQEQRIMYSAQLQLETADVDTAAGQLQTVVTAMDGQIMESRRWTADSRPYLRLQVRVPVERFDESLAALAAVGEVKEQSVQGQDVTQEYVDITARLRNKQQQEQRYLELLGDAQSVDEVLAVERELERIRVEIESMQGRIQFLESRTDFASITVTITEPVTPQWAGVAWDLLLQDMVQVLVDSLQGMLLFLSAILPWAVLVIIVLWLLLRRRR